MNPVSQTNLKGLKTFLLVSIAGFFIYFTAQITFSAFFNKPPLTAASPDIQTRLSGNKNPPTSRGNLLGSKNPPTSRGNLQASGSSETVTKDFPQDVFKPLLAAGKQAQEDPDFYGIKTEEGDVLGIQTTNIDQLIQDEFKEAMIFNDKHYDFNEDGTVTILDYPLFIEFIRHQTGD